MNKNFSLKLGNFSKPKKKDGQIAPFNVALEFFSLTSNSILSTDKKIFIQSRLFNVN